MRANKVCVCVGTSSRSRSQSQEVCHSYDSSTTVRNWFVPLRICILKGVKKMLTQSSVTFSIENGWLYAFNLATWTCWKRKRTKWLRTKWTRNVQNPCRTRITMTRRSEWEKPRKEANDWTVSKMGAFVLVLALKTSLDFHTLLKRHIGIFERNVWKRT